MTTVLFIHGLESGPRGHTARALADAGFVVVRFAWRGEGNSTPLGDADPVIAHTAFRALAMMNASDACFAIVDNYDAPAAQRRGAFLALMRMHTPEVVKGLIERLAKTSGTKEREGIEAALGHAEPGNLLVAKGRHALV